MDTVDLPLPSAVVTKLMRSSGCGGGGGVTRVELATSQSESATCSSSFHPTKGNNCNINGSRPAFWNKISDVDLHKQASELSSLGNEEAFIDHHDMGHIQSSFDTASISQAKQSQRKSGKAARSNGNCSRRSRVAHMEASFNVTGSVDGNGSPKELGSYPGKCNISEKMQTAKQKTVSVKRSEKRNAKISKSKYDSFSIKAGLSSFSSAAGGNNIFGVYGSKQDICDVAKHVDELSVNELLDGSYKRLQSVKEEEKKTANLKENILHSVREACSILQLRKSTLPQNLPVVDSTYHQNTSSCLPNSGTFGASKSYNGKGDIVDPSSCNKVEDSCSGLIDRPCIFEFPLYAPKDVMDRLALSPPKDLDLLLLDSLKPTSTSKGNLDLRLGKPVHSRGGLPTFPWSHISGGHFKTSPDVVKLTPNKSTCQGRWVKIANSTTCGDATTFLADLESLTYDQSLVPLGCQQPGPTDRETSPLPSVTDITFERGLAPSGVRTIDSDTPDGHAPGVLSAAQTLCEIAAHFQQQYQNVMRWPKKPSQKSMRATKLKSDEQLDKALFTIPISKSMGPTNLDNSADMAAMIHMSKRLDKPEARHHDNGPMKRPFITPTSTRLSNKPPKQRKLVPMEWRTRSPADKTRSTSDGRY